MKKSIFITLLFVLFTVVSFGIPEKTDRSVSNSQTEEQIKDKIVIESLSIEILQSEMVKSCTVTIEASIGYNSSYIKVTVSSTAETCEEALGAAIGTLIKAKEMIRQL